MIWRTVVFILVSLMTTIHVQAAHVRIYAAASLSNVIQDIAKLYQSKHPQVKIIPVFGASSTLAKQIEAGAPSDIYFSADLDWMKYLQQKQKVQVKTIQNILENELVLISAENSIYPIPMTQNSAFIKNFSGRLCTGQMQSVPVGKYAKQGLKYMNWFNSLSTRIVETDDVRAALTFVERKECQLGIVYKTDAKMSTKVKIISTFPSQSHEPIVYPIALTRTGARQQDAVSFYQFIKTSPESRQIYQKYGFGLQHEGDVADVAQSR